MKINISRILMYICCLAMLAGCGQIDLPDNIFSRAQEINVSFYESGQQESWTLTNADDIAGLASWWSNLQLKAAPYAIGESPGTSDGGMLYLFETDNSAVSYVINGEESCYVEYGGQWYDVINPCMPFDE